MFASVKTEHTNKNRKKKKLWQFLLEIQRIFIHEPIPDGDYNMFCKVCRCDINISYGEGWNGVNM